MSEPPNKRRKLFPPVHPRRTSNSLRPIVESPLKDIDHASLTIELDPSDPLPFLHAHTPFRCKAAAKHTTGEAVETHRLSHDIEMNAPLHLCSVRFRIDVNPFTNEALQFKTLATTDHGELTDVLQLFEKQFKNESKSAPTCLEQFCRIMTAYWTESMRRAMFFVDCERRYWRLLGKDKPPDLPIPPNLWKGSKKRKRNAIPLFEKVMRGIDEDEMGVKAIYGRPELLHKVGGARIRLMTLKHAKTSLSIGWNFSVDMQGKVASEILALAGEDDDTKPSESNKKDDIVVAGFSSGARSGKGLPILRVREQPIDFASRLNEQGLRNATHYAARTLFPEDMVKEDEVFITNDTYQQTAELALQPGADLHYDTDFDAHVNYEGRFDDDEHVVHEHDHTLTSQYDEQLGLPSYPQKTLPSQYQAELPRYSYPVAYH